MAVQSVTSEHRVYRKANGDMCFEGDPEAAYLAYPVGAEIPLQDADEYRELVEVDRKAKDEPSESDSEEKQANKPADKRRRRPSDK